MRVRQPKLFEARCVCILYLCRATVMTCLVMILAASDFLLSSCISINIKQGPQKGIETWLKDPSTCCCAPLPECGRAQQEKVRRQQS